MHLQCLLGQVDIELQAALGNFRSYQLGTFLHQPVHIDCLKLY